MQARGLGRRFFNEVPGTKGSDYIEVSIGNPASPDKLHQGPYVKIVRFGRTVRIPLKGNLELR
jgi:hypothetical protein